MGHIQVLSDLYEDPNRKIDIDAISYAPKVCLVSLGYSYERKRPPTM